MSVPTTVRTIARTIAILCLAAVLSVVLLGVLGLVFFTLRPPFSQPETGHLRTDIGREVRLTPASPVAVLEMQVRHDPRIFSDSPSATFDATSLRVGAVLADGAQTPIRIRVYPADGEPVTDLSPAADGRSIRWLLDCEAIGARDCARTYLLVISADRLDADLRVTMGITAELRFPPHVPTPFLVSIGLDAEEVRGAASAVALHADSAAGSIEVSPEAPVTYQALAIPPWHSSLRTEGGARGSGLTLELTASRQGDGIPVGLLAPPPVRAAIVDGDGAVVIDVGVRPGQPTIVTLPPIEGEYRLIAWWQDRAAQTYDVDWRLELGSVAARAGPGIGVGDATPARAMDRRTWSGESHFVVGANRSDLAIDVGIDLGGVEHEHLAPGLGVLRLEVELDAEATTGPLILRLTPSEYSGGEEVPVTLRPGEPVALALDATPRCDRGRCELWRGRLTPPGWGSASGTETVALRWRAELGLWPLDPLAEAPSFYEVEE